MSPRAGAFFPFFIVYPKDCITCPQHPKQLGRNPALFGQRFLETSRASTCAGRQVLAWESEGSFRLVSAHTQRMSV